MKKVIGISVLIAGIIMACAGIKYNQDLRQGFHIKTINTVTKEIVEVKPSVPTNLKLVTVYKKYIRAECEDSREACAPIGRYQFLNANKEIILAYFCEDESPIFQEGQIIELSMSRDKDKNCDTLLYARIVSEKSK